MRPLIAGFRCVSVNDVEVECPPLPASVHPGSPLALLHPTRVRGRQFTFAPEPGRQDWRTTKPDGHVAMVVTDSALFDAYRVGDLVPVGFGLPTR